VRFWFGLVTGRRCRAPVKKVRIARLLWIATGPLIVLIVFLRVKEYETCLLN